MATVSLAGPTPPEPRRKTKRPPRSEALWILGLLPLYWRRRFPIEMEGGRMIELNLIWASPHIWERMPESQPGSAWHSCNVGFATLAFRVDL